VRIILRRLGLARIPAGPQLLLRTTIAVGIIAAIAITVARNGNGSMTGNQLGAPGTSSRAGMQPAAILPPTSDAVSAISSTPAPTSSSAISAPTSGTASRNATVPTASSGQSNGSAPNPSSGVVARAPCQITYRVAQTTSQFTITIVIANTSSVKVDGWTLHWDFPSNQEITYGWNAMVTNGPRGAEATDVGLNMIIPAHGSTTIGFAGKLRDWVPTPSGFTLNGATCQWKPAEAASTPAR